MPLQLSRQQVEGQPDVRVYHSRFPLTEKPEETAQGNEHSDNAVLDIAANIPGVAMVVAKRYALVIMRSPMFEWAEIEVHLLRLLTAVNLGEGKLMMEDGK